MDQAAVKVSVLHDNDWSGRVVILSHRITAYFRCLLSNNKIRTGHQIQTQPKLIIEASTGAILRRRLFGDVITIDLQDAVNNNMSTSLRSI